MPVTREADAIVVGAGVAGLSAALALAREGLRVLVLEAAQEAGGRARSWIDTATGVEVDIGPHVVSSEHRNFLRVLSMCGTEGLLHWQRQPLVTLLDARGVLRVPRSALPPPLHGLPMLPSALARLGWGDLLSHARIAWHAARHDEESLRALDGESALGLLRRLGVNDAAIEWFWRSGLLALLNVRLEDCSAAAAMRVFRLMLGRSGWHFAFPRVGLSALYVPGCEAAVRKARGAIVTGAAVRRIEPAETMHRVHLAGGDSAVAAQVIVALPPAEAAALAAASGTPALAGLRAAGERFRPSPYVSTMLWFDRSVTREAFWARAWQDDGLNTDFYDLSNIRPALAGGGSLVACNAIGPLARPEWDDERIVATSLRELCDFAPAARAAKVVHHRVHRIPMAIPRPEPGTETARPRTGTGVPRLWLAGDWTDTAVPCSMESAARSGFLAAEAALGALGRAARYAIDAPETYGLPALLRRR